MSQEKNNLNLPLSGPDATKSSRRIEGVSRTRRIEDGADGEAFRGRPGLTFCEPVRPGDPIGPIQPSLAPKYQLSFSESVLRS